MSSTCDSSDILKKLRFSWYISGIYSSIRFHENPFRGNWVVACGQADRQTDINRHGWADMTKLIFAFCNFANAFQNDKNQRNTIVKTDKLHFHVVSRISIIIEGVGKENIITHTELLNPSVIINTRFFSNLSLPDSFSFWVPNGIILRSNWYKHCTRYYVSAAV